MKSGKDIISTVIGVVIALSLTPVITTIIDDLNETGTLGTLLNLVPVIWIAGVIALAIAWVK